VKWLPLLEIVEVVCLNARNKTTIFLLVSIVRLEEVPWFIKMMGVVCARR